MKYFELTVWLLLSGALCAGAWVGALPYSLTETLGFVTGAACVYLVIRQNIWNFPVGIANNVFFLVLFTRSRLYGDAGLQLVYVALGAQGWYAWLYGGARRTPLKVARASAWTLAALAAFVLLGTAALTAALRLARGSAPVLDAFTTVLSLAAQYMLNRKLVENWYVWLAADVLYVYLYVARDLRLTALLYFVFLCMCVAGLLSWRRALNTAADAPHAGADLA
ncbi:MAG TPA: nicotinamide riboside transporter PnuC [Pyrinomonadaceae bacterium]|jgi:nicotinamide mononucleotide transporter